MNRYHLFSFIFLIAGIIFFFIGVLSDDVETGFLIVFPFIAGSGIFAFLGVICIVLAFFMYLFAFSVGFRCNDLDEFEDNNFKSKKTSIKGGGVVLIGPIPIIFGSNWKITVLMVLLAIILIILSVFVLKIM